MRLLPIALLVAGVALLQTSVAPYFSVGGVTFDLVLVGVIVWGIGHSPGQALLWVAVGGGIVDLFSGLPWGSSVLALLPAALLTITAQASVVESRLLLTFAVVAGGTLAAGIVRLIIAASLGAPAEIVPMLGVALLPQVVANTLLASLLLPLVRGLSLRGTTPRRAGG